MKTGTKFRLVQKPELATHLVMWGTKALCGTELGPHPSYSVPAVVGANNTLFYFDGSPALRHVDCKRCLATFSKPA